VHRIGSFLFVLVQLKQILVLLDLPMMMTWGLEALAATGYPYFPRFDLTVDPLFLENDQLTVGLVRGLP
jgi:hypothetical protein